MNALTNLSVLVMTHPAPVTFTLATTRGHRLSGVPALMTHPAVTADDATAADEARAA